MNESTEIVPFQSAIQKVRDRFSTIAQRSLNYDNESVFAMQALMKTDYAMKVANQNPQSVQLAMINVASTGLTLNPANGYAYLVPRDSAIVLDISYKGLIEIATDAGSIVWARADVVHERDTFRYNGPAMLPDHQSDPFSTDRGEVIGCYCIAKTAGGDILTEVLDRAEIEKIQGKSDLFAKRKSGPWVEWFTQMCKKAVIKRAAKTWPYTDKSERFNEAIMLANESEGGYTLSPEDAARKRKQDHDAALGRWYKSVDYIKVELSKDIPDLHGVSEAWGEIPQDDQMALWLAPTKGGVFTTKERKTIKEDLPRGAAPEAEGRKALQIDPDTGEVLPPHLQ